MKSKFWSILEGIMLILWIIVTIIFVITACSKGIKCVANPLIYGVNKLQTENNNTYFSCNCIFENSPDFKIFVDNKHWELKKNELNITS
jgi:hypothetical protein